MNKYNQEKPQLNEVFVSEAKFTIALSHKRVVLKEVGNGGFQAFPKTYFRDKGIWYSQIASETPDAVNSDPAIIVNVLNPDGESVVLSGVSFNGHEFINPENPNIKYPAEKYVHHLIQIPKK